MKKLLVLFVAVFAAQASELSPRQRSQEKLKFAQRGSSPAPDKTKPVSPRDLVRKRSQEEIATRLAKLQQQRPDQGGN